MSTKYFPYIFFVTVQIIKTKRTSIHLTVHMELKNFVKNTIRVRFHTIKTALHFSFFAVSLSQRFSLCRFEKISFWQLRCWNDISMLKIIFYFQMRRRMTVKKINVSLDKMLHLFRSIFLLNYSLTVFSLERSNSFI